ncbi:MAG: hypothetical protein LBC88_07210, partial [Spirochaetaceae bacterium]|nr:hypothetical protein [Spirochaetaceae bacterium]
AITLALAACLNPIGLPSYGSTQGSTGGGNILPGEGRLIIKNLTRDLVIHKVSFTPLSGQDSAPDLEPGPEKSNQRSVPLPSGLWKITLIYGTGYTTSINDVMITEGNAATVYFYKTTSGRGSLETQWLPPTDADLSGNANPGDVLSDDEGFLHVINKSQVSIITGVEYNNGATWIAAAIPAPAGMSGNIAAGQGSAPDLILPRGSWAIRFRLLGKDIPSVAVSKTVIAGQTVTVDYTDSLLTDRPPSGFGSLRIVNKLPHDPITRIVVRTQATGYAPEDIDLSTPIPQDGGSQVRILRAGDLPGAQRDYIVQCYVAVNEYYEAVARIIDETISEVFIMEDSSKTTEGGAGGGGSAADGALTVYNRYAGQLPFKIFKIYLYQETGPGAWQDYVPPAHALYPKAPTSNQLNYNGAAGYEGEPFISKGEYHTFGGIPEGAYKLLIVGGSYHWQYYTASPAHQAGGLQINEKRITYDCGNIFIAGGGTKVYNFDPYVQGVPDRDTPTGAVKISLQHMGNTGGLYGDSGPISSIQFVAGSESETAVSAAFVYNIVQSNRTAVAPQSSTKDVWSGVPDRFIVYENHAGLMPGQKLEVVLPPGVYGVRVRNPAGDGAASNKWYGRNQHWFFDLHIAAEAARTVNLQWKWPSVSLLSENLVRNSGKATVTDSSLAMKIGSILSSTNLGTYIDPANANWTQYEVYEARWFFNPNDTRPIESSVMIGMHYYSDWDRDNGQKYDSYPARINTSDWKLYGRSSGGGPSVLWTAFNGGTATVSGSLHGSTALPRGYYTLELTLQAKNGYTFEGFSPSADPPIDIHDVNNQGTGISFNDYVSTSTNTVGFNNPTSTRIYRIRRWYLPEYQNWITTDGMIANTGKLPGEDRIRVRVSFKQVP